MKKLFIALAVIGVLFSTYVAFAYDATANFSQAHPELVSGFYFKAGPTKGGPYPSVTDCGKPTPKADGTYDCVGKNFTANPVYGVVSNYDAAKKEIATSTEAMMSITVTPPGNLKLIVVVQTISKLNRNGRPTSTTTVKRFETKPGQIVKEGVASYRNSRGEWVTNTTIIM